MYIYKHIYIYALSVVFGGALFTSCVGCGFGFRVFFNRRRKTGVTSIDHDAFLPFLAFALSDGDHQF